MARRPPWVPRPPAPPPPPPPRPRAPRMQTMAPQQQRNPALTPRKGPTGRSASMPPQPGAATLPPRPPLAQRTGPRTRPIQASGAAPVAGGQAAGPALPPRDTGATMPRPGARLVSRAGQNPTKAPVGAGGGQTIKTAKLPANFSQVSQAPSQTQPPQSPPRGPARGPRREARRGPPLGPRRPKKGKGRKKPPPPGARARASKGDGGTVRQGGQGRALWGVVLLLLLVVGGIGGYFGYLWHQFHTAGPAPVAVRVQVAQGATLKGVLNELGGKGALDDKFGTLMYLRVTGETPRVKVGTYEFPAHASPAKIIAMLNDGKVVLEQVTVIEGSTFADFRRTLDESPVVTHALRGKSDAQVMAALGHAREFPEGRFFPDTYLFAAQTSDLEILQIAYNKMQHLLDKEWPAHDPSLPYSTPYEALTMASLVEKETGVPAERPRIAGVFINRLRKGMRLQTDPAVIYGLGPAYDGNIHKKDLETDNPYNTYTRNGLPPTPIALPGKEAVLAAIHPDNTDALYFVATGSGGHHFSATLEEHNAAVRSYLLSRRAQGGAAGAQ